MSQPVKAPKVFKPVIVTANGLASGEVLFRHADGGWSIDVSKAEIAETREAGDELMARALADQEACIVVEPALIEIVREGGFVRPASLRELIRASGPTVALPSDAYAHL
ncbi:DUF2849 domain-containing protein [Phreatobacter sp. AB_2022a]|uniref:DUF2849 domain-containing protein n=1 Tax=Phreatobacter sp. AB_2022a TaxID=3003134 RepID=UPI0022870125|nr:DUF2849 domain-containing protein [Phreatobacter sp. AB_2022a]MCZ0736143.1 DUF2849 domain-containing protein [Phreatobacter sp. AB_2022a]